MSPDIQPRRAKRSQYTAATTVCNVLWCGENVGVRFDVGRFRWIGDEHLGG